MKPLLLNCFTDAPLAFATGRPKMKGTTQLKLGAPHLPQQFEQSQRAQRSPWSDHPAAPPALQSVQCIKLRHSQNLPVGVQQQAAMLSDRKHCKLRMHLTMQLHTFQLWLFRVQLPIYKKTAQPSHPAVPGSSISELSKLTVQTLDSSDIKLPGTGC
jgi:hypothetical protein